MCKTVDCDPGRGTAAGAFVRAVGAVAGVALGVWLVAGAGRSLAAVAVAVVAVEAVLAVAGIAVLARNLRRARPVWRPAVARAEVQPRALAAAPLAIESGLLTGQTDPAMREVLRGISRGLRERYGAPSAPARVVPGMVTGEEVRSDGQELFQQQRER